MPRKRRYFKHKEAGFITSRVADGLPFIPLTFMNNIIKGILARAQTLYPVEICHFIFMANHYHILAICDESLCKEHLKVVEEIEKEKGDQTHYFDLKPYAWLKCFDESKGWSVSEAKSKVQVIFCT